MRGAELDEGSAEDGTIVRIDEECPAFGCGRRCHYIAENEGRGRKREGWMGGRGWWRGEGRGAGGGGGSAQPARSASGG